MKFSEKWLRSLVDLPHDRIEDLTYQMTMLGLEVDGYELAAPPFEKVVVAEILSAEKHPNADKLKVCTVNVGEGEPLNIVCGASNAREGIKVPVALVGAVLPGGFTIKKAKLRQVESMGMICASSELGLTEESQGIMEFPEDAPVGENIRDYLELDDHVIDVSITPNRGDCFSLRGIANDLAGANQRGLKQKEISEITPVHSEVFPVEVKASESCPRYAGRLIKNIDASAKTPVWMQERLNRSGVRSINAVVDVTNYVMLELGQPLHAFDFESLSKGIVVRESQKGEKASLLDGKTLSLEEGTLVIADQSNIQALAGVMGGGSSMVSETTKNVFLESAFFSPLTVRKSVQTYGIHSDSSQRFERGVDPAITLKALDRATELILSIVGGEPGEVNVVESPKHLPILPNIPLRESKVKQILGFEIDSHEIERILKHLNMSMEKTREGWEVTPPSYRFDMAIEADLIEELARVYGYDNIPVKKEISYLIGEKKAEPKLDLMELRKLLENSGYHEVINYSFISEEYHKIFSSKEEPIELANPISQDMSVMRASLWPGLVKNFLYNQHRDQSRARLFEVGVCFFKENSEYVHKNKVAGLIAGDFHPQQWAEKSRKVDYFDVKGDIEKLLSGLPIEQIEFLSDSDNLYPVFHPGQSALIVVQNQVLGYVGALHPQVAAFFKIKTPIFLFEVDVSLLNSLYLEKQFEVFSKYPSVRRDISLIVDQDCSWEILKKKIASFRSEYLSKAELFDIYVGESIELGKKSVSIALVFQSGTKTLVENEINQQVENFLSFLKETVDFKLRD